MTYKIVKSPAKAWTWERYEKRILKEWRNLLDNKGNYTERDFQSFLEMNPCFLPSPPNKGLILSSVITQPLLGGINSKIPDFILITHDSATICANLIEIEDPKKKWARVDEVQTADLTQAINQIKDWKSWFADGLNREKFLDEYEIRNFSHGRYFKQNYVLIYGRRNDPSLTESFNKKRGNLGNDDELFMTYDRLFPNCYLSNYMTVRLTAKGYKAVHIPPTLEITPGHMLDWYSIANKEKAVNKNKYLSNARKKFLNSRWNYWENWVREDDVKLHNSDDRE